MKINLTISENYCDSWGLFEAVREFVQNGRDATRAGCTFDVDYDDQSNLIRIRTVGASLKHSTLLLGQSSKRGDTNMLGEHGEGYKIGSLVLCRLGKGVKIRTADELWIPTLEFSRKFGAKVLTFDITGNRKNINEVVVEISGVSQDEWDSIKGKFIFIHDNGMKITRTPVGSIIHDGEGNLFADGIWVCQNEELRHGYDFRPVDVKLDRDRRMMSGWDARSLSSRAWESVYSTGNDEECMRVVDAMLADNAPDVEHFRYSWCVGMATRKQVAKRFQEKFGDAVAVRTESEVRELEFLGKKGAIVESESLREILEGELGTLESTKKILAQDVLRELTTVDLTPVESHNMLIALEFVSKATKYLGFDIAKDITIAEFRSPSIMGMRKQGKIYLSRNTLTSLKEAIKTLVEEVAHEVGADGTHVHVERMHEIYASGVELLLNGSFVFKKR